MHGDVKAHLDYICKLPAMIPYTKTPGNDPAISGHRRTVGYSSYHRAPWTRQAASATLNQALCRDDTSRFLDGGLRYRRRLAVRPPSTASRSPDGFNCLRGAYPGNCSIPASRRFSLGFASSMYSAPVPAHHQRHNRYS